MLSSVLAKTLRDLRRGFAWWSVGLVGMVALMVSVYPTVRDNPALDKLAKSYPDALTCFSRRRSLVAACCSRSSERFLPRRRG